MLRRVGVVAWWFGALVGVSIIGVAGYSWLSIETNLRDCPARLKLYQEIEDTEKVAQDRWIKEHGTGSKMADQINVLLTGPADDPRRTESFMKQVELCLEPPKRDAFGIAALIGAIVTLCCWAVAFVLSGSFWTPPRRH